METKEKEFIDIFLKEDEKYIQLINLFHLKNNGILDLYKELYNEGSIIKIKSCMKSADKMVEVLNNLDEYSLTKSYNDSNEKILTQIKNQFKNKIKYKDYVKLSSFDVDLINRFYNTIRAINENYNIIHINEYAVRINLCFNVCNADLETLSTADIYFLKEFQKEFKDDLKKINLDIKNILTVETFDLEKLILGKYKQNQKWDYIISKKDYDNIFKVINNEKNMYKFGNALLFLDESYYQYNYKFQNYINDVNKIMKEMKYIYNEIIFEKYGDKYFICEDCKELIDIYNENIDINDVIFDEDGSIKGLSEYNTDSSGYLYCNKCAEKLTYCSMCGSRYNLDEIHNGVCGNCDDEETI